MVQVQAADAAAEQTAAELINADKMQAKVHPAANCLPLTPWQVLQLLRQNAGHCSGGCKHCITFCHHE